MSGLDYIDRDIEISNSLERWNIVKLKHDEDIIYKKGDDELHIPIYKIGNAISWEANINNDYKKFFADVFLKDIENHIHMDMLQVITHSIFDKNQDPVMPLVHVKTNNDGKILNVFDDPSLQSQNREGMYGWVEVGISCIYGGYEAIKRNNSPIISK